MLATIALIVDKELAELASVELSVVKPDDHVGRVLVLADEIHAGVLGKNLHLISLIQGHSIGRLTPVQRVTTHAANGLLEPIIFLFLHFAVLRHEMLDCLDFDALILIEELKAEDCQFLPRFFLNLIQVVEQLVFLLILRLLFLWLDFFTNSRFNDRICLLGFFKLSLYGLKIILQVLNAIVRLALYDLHVALWAESVDFAEAMTVFFPVQFGQIIHRLILQRMRTHIALILTFAHVFLIVSDILLVREHLLAAIDRFATFRGVALKFHGNEPLFQLS